MEEILYSGNLGHLSAWVVHRQTRICYMDSHACGHKWKRLNEQSGCRHLNQRYRSNSQETIAQRSETRMDDHDHTRGRLEGLKSCRQKQKYRKPTAQITCGMGSNGCDLKQRQKANFATWLFRIQQSQATAWEWKAVINPFPRIKALSSSFVEQKKAGWKRELAEQEREGHQERVFPRERGEESSENEIKAERKWGQTLGAGEEEGSKGKEEERLIRDTSPGHKDSETELKEVNSSFHCSLSILISH